MKYFLIAMMTAMHGGMTVGGGIQLKSLPKYACEQEAHWFTKNAKDLAEATCQPIGQFTPTITMLLDKGYVMHKFNDTLWFCQRFADCQGMEKGSLKSHG